MANKEKLLQREETVSFILPEQQTCRGRSDSGDKFSSVSNRPANRRQTKQRSSSPVNDEYFSPKIRSQLTRHRCQVDSPQPSVRLAKDGLPSFNEIKLNERLIFIHIFLNFCSSSSPLVSLLLTTSFKRLCPSLGEWSSSLSEGVAWIDECLWAQRWTKACTERSSLFSLWSPTGITFSSASKQKLIAVSFSMQMRFAVLRTFRETLSCVRTIRADVLIRSLHSSPYSRRGRNLFAVRFIQPLRSEKERSGLEFGITAKSNISRRFSDGREWMASLPFWRREVKTSPIRSSMCEIKEH